MLTRKQLDLLNYINKHLNKDGIPPSFDEMKEALFTIKVWNSQTP